MKHARSVHASCAPPAAPSCPQEMERARATTLLVFMVVALGAWVLVFLCCLHTGRLARMQDHKRKGAGWKISASSHLQTLRMHAAYMRTCICVCVETALMHLQNFS